MKPKRVSAAKRTLPDGNANREQPRSEIAGKQFRGQRNFGTPNILQMMTKRTTPAPAESEDEFEVRPFPLQRALVVDAGYLSHKRHIVHGLVSVNVTRARSIVKERELSFTAFVVASIGRAVAEHRNVQAYRDFWGRLIVYKNCDIVTMVEPFPDAVAIPHIVRNANLRSVVDITKEIRSIQRSPESSGQQGGMIDVAARLPRWIRMVGYRWIRGNPHRLKRLMGTVIVTAVGMFGSDHGGEAYGVGFLPLHTLGVTVGGIAKRMTLASDGSLEMNEYLSLTLSFDHDVVDGAPAARFTSDVAQIMESASVLLT